jgi:hypothetical protein
MKQIYTDNSLRANIFSITRVIYFCEPLATNVSLLELVAAYGKLFFHNRPSEVMKSTRTIYRKTSHEF